MPGNMRKDYVAVHPLSRRDLLDAFDRVVATRDCSYACFCDAHLFIRAAREREARNALAGAGFVLADGIAVLLAARLLGTEIPERIPGPFLMRTLCEHGLQKGYKHFFYGSTEAVLARLVGELSGRLPGLRIVGTHSPPYRVLSPSEDAEITERINSCHPDIVWVALGAPKQEIWAHDHLGRLNAPLILPVGAAFDFLSGTVPRAPLWVQRMGMEWLYRAFTGGRRVFLRNAKYDFLMLGLLVRLFVRHRLSLARGTAPGTGTTP